MLLLAATFVAAISPISPLTIDVTTRDGAHRAVEVTDADAAPVQVCAHRRNQADAPVCGDVVSDRYGLRANVDVVDDGEVVFDLRVTRFDVRAGAPAAVAAGFGALAVAAGVSAVVLGSLSASGAVDAGAAGAAPVASADVSGLALVCWTVSGASVVGAGVAGFIAWGEAHAVVAE